MTNSKLMNRDDPFLLPKELDSAQGLLIFEDQAAIASGDVAESTVRLAYHVYMICYHQLWRHVVLKDGKTPAFGSQNEYLDFLGDRINAGVSTLKAYYASMKLARGLGYTIADIQQKGLSIFAEVFRRVKLNRATGEPVALRSGNVPEGYNIVGYLQEVIEEVGPSDVGEMRYRAGDIKLELDRRLDKDKPIVMFDIPDPSRPEIVTWHVELWQGDMLVEVPGNHSRVSKNMPDYVKVAWFKKIGVSWKLESQDDYGGRH